VWNWGVRRGGSEAGSGRRLQGGHPDLAGWRLRRRRGNDRARAGAVRRAACAEPICVGGSLPSTPRLRRRRSSGWARWARELLRRYHNGSQERRAFASANLGGARRPRPGRSLRGRAGGLPSHGGAMARVWVVGCGSCSGATTRTRRRGGAANRGKFAVHDQAGAGACAGGREGGGFGSCPNSLLALWGRARDR
jgi:hypothetical protein